MVLSRSSVFINIVEEDCPMGEAIDLDSGKVYGTLSFIFPTFFLTHPYSSLTFWFAINLNSHVLKSSIPTCYTTLKLHLLYTHLVS